MSTIIDTHLQFPREQYELTKEPYGTYNDGGEYNLLAAKKLLRIHYYYSCQHYAHITRCRL